MTPYALPQLPYALNALESHMSEAQLRLHYEKHHAAYVSGANAILDRLEKARKDGTDVDVKSALKELSFQVGGHRLHSLFWAELVPDGKKLSGTLAAAIDVGFGSFSRFRAEFTKAAAGVEGSGWAALAYCPETKSLLIMQIEKHNNNVIPSYPILLVVDVFEHAYYVDYKNERAKYVEAFWNIVNWEEVSRRFEAAKI